MQKEMFTVATLAVSLLASSVVHAADTAELQVRGAILPSACVPGFASGGIVDYGTILAKDVPLNANMALGERNLTFTVTCDNAAKIALRAVDNRASSIVPGLLAEKNGAEYTDSYAFGLGVVAGKTIGVYKVNMSMNVTADNAIVSVLNSIENAPWFVATSSVNHFRGDGQIRKSFAAGGATTPSAFKTVSGLLAISAILNKGSDLPLTQEIPLDGSATIEVLYL